jgi:hypothetical protein
VEVLIFRIFFNSKYKLFAKIFTKKIKYFKIFKINYKFLEIKKLKPAILKKLIIIKNKYGNFIPYSYSTILIKVTTLTIILKITTNTVQTCILIFIK